VSGLPFRKGNLTHYWNPIRSAFQELTGEQRWRELLDDVGDDGTRKQQRNLDFYLCRHFCASMLADRGASMADIAHQLGNSEQVCRDTYTHSYVDRANDRVRALLDQGRVNDLDALRRRRGSN
jgi:integrase